MTNEAVATACATQGCAVLVDPRRTCIHAPMAVSRMYQQMQHNQQKQQIQRKRTTNGNSTPSKTNKSAKRPIVRLTNKQRIESKLLNLTLDVHALREEIHSMEFYRKVLQSRVLFKPQAADGSIVRSAQQFFQVFRRGYRVTEAVTQHEYLEAAVDEACVITRCPWAVKLDALGATDVGRSALLEQWQKHAEYFAFRFVSPPTFAVVSTDDNATCVVRCETTLNASFTWQSLELIFPAVKADPVLLQQLLGREMVTPICFHLHFDRQGRIIRYDFEVDFVAALVYAMKDPIRAAEIVAATYVTKSDELVEEPKAEDTDATDRQESCGDDSEQETREPVAKDVRLSVAYLLS